MTEHKHLKRLIRERIAATGESYSTARRHVLALIGRQTPAPEALSPVLVPGYDTFGGGQRLVLTGPVAAVDLAGAVRSALATTVAHLTGPVLGHAFDVNFGFSGMRRLAQQLRADRGKDAWARRFASPEAPAFALRRLYECLELQRSYLQRAQDE